MHSSTLAAAFGAISPFGTVSEIPARPFESTPMPARNLPFQPNKRLSIEFGPSEIYDLNLTAASDLTLLQTIVCDRSTIGAIVRTRRQYAWIGPDTNGILV